MQTESMKLGRNARAIEGITMLRESRTASDKLVNTAAEEYRLKKSEVRQKELEALKNE